MTTLQTLDHAVGRLVANPAFRVGREQLDVHDYVRPLPEGRVIKLGDLRTTVDEAMSRWPNQPVASDPWLAPRLHAALRLTRREAAERGIWRYLGVVEFADYVRWRWWNPSKAGSEAAPGAERFIGPDYKQAFARLWWMAELFRDGPDYGPVALAMNVQDIQNNLFRMDIAHHRPTVQAVLRVLNRPAVGMMSGRHANALAKATNAAASTLVIDRIAPDVPLDSYARERWIAAAGDYDPRRYFDELPDGPDDPRVPAESIKTMSRMLTELLAEAPVRGQRKEEEATAQ